ncbi:MAG TPA: hypothetical protein VEY91_02195 [Candidatus Limnocylindria bacterium]|nr:hypothetical protein [Candidatus Limnocylindria bacterium]
MHSPNRLTLILLLVLGFLAGCSPSGDPLSPGEPDGSGSDQTEVQDEIARHPDMVEDGVYESEGTIWLGTVTPQGSLAAITPLTYWRKITSVDRRLEVVFSDPDSSDRPTTATVTVHKRLHGSFNILTGDVPEDSVRSVVRKRLNDHWVRRVLLKRIWSEDASDRNRWRWRWRVAAITGVQVTAHEAQTRIVSLEVQAGVMDTTITDPLVFFRLRRILQLEPETEVTLTVTTLRNDDVVVLHHRDRRFRFHNNGDNTYSGVWRVGAVAGLRHVGVNALSHGTLYDDQERYDSQSWILPYLVRPNQLAEYAD